MPLKANKEEPLTEKSGQPKSSLPLPMPMASWPGGLPPMGYMAPLQGVVSMDGTTVTPAPMQPLFSQPRSKRCATHCYIARNIHYLQQLMKMNPFWQAAAGSASLFGSKPCNLNIMPADLHSNMAARGLNNAPDKGQCLSSSPSNGGKDKGSQPVGTSDSAQRKQQLLIQQALPPVAPNNLLGPAFIFPLNQQAAVAAASARPSSIKSPPTTGGTASSTTSGSVGAGTSPAAAMSFNYPGMPTNETQYLAILRNNGYPFPIPTVGAPPNYRGTAPQAMPLFNGSFYSSQMIHPSQLQHPQTQSAHPPQLQHAHQNASVSSGSASQKHLLTQSSNVNSGAGSANLQNFPSQKSQPSQQLQHASRPKHLESEPGSEDSAPTTDGRGSRASVNIYGQNFAMPIHPQNFALMTQSATLASAAAASGSSNQSEKKPQQPQQAVPPNSFAMSFGPTNGSNTGPGIDITAMAHNHAIFQSFPDATRQNIQMMAAAAQAAQKKNFRTSEDDKSGGGDSSVTDEERKNLVAKAPSGVGQSLTFARSDSANASVSSIQANSVVESSNRSQPLTANTAGVIHATNVNIHGLFQQQQQQQILQLKQKHQQQLAVNRSKAPATSNGIVFSDNLNSSSTMAAKFPNALAGFPQNLVQSNSSGPSQSPQWKSSTRAPTSQAPSALASSTATTLKNPPQQHSRAPTKMQTQISFGGNQNPSTTSQGQQPPSSNQVPSPPMMVGSPTTSSVSKGASGSPRTTSSASTNTKTGQSPSLPTQQQKNSSSIPSQKSQSILGNPHVASSSGSGAKPPMQQQSQLQQQQQQQLPKTMQHAQFFFSNPYSQAQSPHSISTSSSTSGPSGFYMQRRRPDQQQQQPAGLSTSSTGVLSLCPPVTLASTSTNDPTKAIAAVTSNAKGGGLPSQGIIHAAQFAAQSGGNLMPAGFSYVHPATTAVQVKPAEQKQPAA
ncbi:hypothetical protein CDL12_26583 [Handroanthus impetiginosus]|uniref:Protein TIME FOR COFFEE n=1 Tax=Handroanthus impetiginosus TaxID=429701 RepID=A0A2G9G6S9_9LAMI|nr:hypothetical protein CDL12_26583 [Handroanthus impetiginosus]